MLELGVVHVGLALRTRALHAREPVVIFERGVLFLLDVGQHSRLTTHGPGRGWVRVLWQQLYGLRFDLWEGGLRNGLQPA